MSQTMTFDLTAEQQALIANARTATTFPARAIDAVLVVEEIAASDPAQGARFGFEGVGGTGSATGTPLAGLEGSESALAALPETSKTRARLMAAAVALGIGRTAIAHAIASMKKTGVKPGPDETAPHWTFADGATEVAAAKLLTYNAAQMLDRNEAADDVIARAHAFAARAAQVAVDAAIRVEGAAGFMRGGLLERLSRDARTLQLILR
jgi:Acyl-CoA dehydrogenase, C-terminal domain